MSFSNFVLRLMFISFFKKMAANNLDRFRLDRGTHHASVQCERARHQNEQAKARHGTIPRPHDRKASTSRSHLSHRSSSQGHVSPAHEDRDALEDSKAYAHETSTTNDDVPTEGYLGRSSNTSLVIYYRDHTTEHIQVGEVYLLTIVIYMFYVNSERLILLYFLNRGVNVQSLLTIAKMFCSFIILRMIVPKCHLILQSCQTVLLLVQNHYP